jgi:hypothetical protein
MSKAYISAALRRAVIDRASGCCEYCLIGRQDRPIEFSIDHVIAEKHGGPTEPWNLCLSCYWCNSFKGSDISSVDWDAGRVIVPLFNPREQQWDDHFRIEGAEISALTAVGRVTVFLLHLNDPERIEERRLLIDLGVFPCR